MKKNTIARRFSNDQTVLTPKTRRPYSNWKFLLSTTNQNGSLLDDLIHSNVAWKSCVLNRLTDWRWLSTIVVVAFGWCSCHPPTQQHSSHKHWQKKRIPQTIYQPISIFGCLAFCCLADSHATRDEIPSKTTTPDAEYSQSQILCRQRILEHGRQARRHARMVVP